MRTGLSAIVVLGLLAAPGAAMATTYDTSLNATPGFDTNEHWTVNESYGYTGLQLGLAGLERFQGNYTPLPGSSTYIVQSGTFSSGPNAGQSFWDIAFSLDLGTTNLTLGDVASSLCLTDVAKGTHGCFDPLDPNNIPDNQPAGPDYPSAGANSLTTYDSSKVAQNAETLSFPTIAALLDDSGYDPWIADTYEFDWTLSCNGTFACGLETLPITSVSITLETVPEPSTLALLGGALLGFGFLAFRRRRKPVA